MNNTKYFWRTKILIIHFKLNKRHVKRLIILKLSLMIDYSQIVF